MTSIGIVILNYNGREDTLACLKSVFSVNKSHYELEVVVVDNASKEESAEYIKQRYPNTHILINPENYGFAEGNNVGIRYVLKRGVTHVFVINNDTLLHPQSVLQLIEASKKYQDAILGPKIYFAPGSEYHKQRYTSDQLGKVIWYAGGEIDWNNVLASHRGVDSVDNGQFNEIEKTDFVSGCALFAPSSIFSKIGMFDPKLFLYYEDLDFCQRAKRKGIYPYFVPQSIVWHKNANSAGGAGSDLQTYYITRNRLVIAMRYAPLRARIAILKEATKLLLSGSPTQKMAVGDFFKRKYGKR